MKRLYILLLAMLFPSLLKAQKEERHNWYTYNSYIQRGKKIEFLGVTKWQKTDGVANVFSVKEADSKSFELALQTSKLSLLSHLVGEYKIQILQVKENKVVSTQSLGVFEIEIWSSEIRLTKRQLYSICGMKYVEDESDKEILKDMQEKRMRNFFEKQKKSSPKPGNIQK